MSIAHIRKMSKKKPGEFEADELHFSVTKNGKVTITNWAPKSFLSDKQDIFIDLIGTAH